MRRDSFGGNLGTAENPSTMFGHGFHMCADVCSAFEDRQQLSALSTAIPAATCAAHAHRLNKSGTLQGVPAGTMGTAPVLRGHRQLVQAFSLALGFDDSGFKSRKYARDKSDLESCEERHPTKD